MDANMLPFVEDQHRLFKDAVPKVDVNSSSPPYKVQMTLTIGEEEDLLIDRWCGGFPLCT